MDSRLIWIPPSASAKHIQLYSTYKVLNKALPVLFGIQKLSDNYFVRLVVQHARPNIAWVLAIGPGINYQYSNSELDTESNKPRIKYTKVIIGL